MYLFTGRGADSQELNEIEAFLTSKKAKQFVKTNALPSNTKRWLGSAGRWVEERRGKFLSNQVWYRDFFVGLFFCIRGFVFSQL